MCEIVYLLESCLLLHAKISWLSVLKWHALCAGMDTTEWNPATDKYLDVKYNKSNVFAGKKAAKEALQAELGLDVSSSIPLFGYIGRLEEQKGVDILMKVRVLLGLLSS